MIAFGSVRAHLLTAGNVVRRNVPTHDLVDELNVLTGSRICLHRLDETDDPRILARAAILLVVRVEEVRPLGDRLAEGYTRFARDAVDVVLTLHSLDIDLEVEFQLQDQGSRDFGSEYSSNINSALYSPCSKGAEHQPIETTIIMPNAFIIQEGRIEERV